MIATLSISRAELTKGHVLARSTLWNLAGQILPMVAAFFAIPRLIAGIGLDRFGVLALGWAIVGYFSLFDLGLGRALTKMVSDRIASAQYHDLHAIIWTASFVMLVLGVVAGLGMFVIAPWLVHRALNIPLNLQHETLQALYLLAFSVPVVTSTSGFRGVLEALQHFHTVNRIRIPMAISVFLGPLLVLPFSKSLVWTFAFLVAGRVVAWIAYIVACLKAVPGLGSDLSLERSGLREVLQFGGWITFGNLIVPVLVYTDRFVIGALLSLSAVTYYTTPFEGITKLLVVPGAIAGVMFPAFAATYNHSVERTTALMKSSLKYVSIILFPVVLTAIAFAPEGLRLWVGNEFAVNSSAVLRYLAAGVFVNCLAFLPLSFLQGTGRPDIAAKLQAAELPLYLVLIYWATKHHGLSGAALAWSARVAVDAFLLFIFTLRFLPDFSETAKRLGMAFAGSAVLFYLVTIPSSVLLRAMLVVGISGSVTLWFWLKTFTMRERALLLDFVSRRSEAASLRGENLVS